MSNRALEALRADRQALLEICNQLGEAEFQAESGCPGWSIRDLVAHMGALFWMAVDPSTLPDATGLTTEQAQDVYVDHRRTWETALIVKDYEEVSAEAIDRLAGFEGQDFEIALGDLGTYPADLLINAFTFDHYTHIRADMFGPRGPLTGSPPPSDELRLVPTLDWSEAAIAQQNPQMMGALNGSVEIVLHGIGARTFTVGTGKASARIWCDSVAFIPMVTGRADWNDSGVDATGDETQLELARSIHVF